MSTKSYIQCPFLITFSLCRRTLSQLTLWAASDGCIRLCHLLHSSKLLRSSSIRISIFAIKSPCPFCKFKVSFIMSQWHLYQRQIITEVFAFCNHLFYEIIKHLKMKLTVIRTIKSWVFKKSCVFLCNKCRVIGLWTLLGSV